MSQNVVLYRKYRSKSFSEVVGQGKTVEILKQSILRDRISHAYLFTGPRGTGKTTLARLMAKAVNCERFAEVGDVCNECSNCKSINEYSAIDIVEMDAASNRGIEEIRSLKENVNFAPSFLKKKTYIIDEAHMLTKEAFNALLKTLEEPPEHVLFILATTESHKVPVTILSRVERHDLSLASKEELSTKLNYILEAEGIKVEEGVLDIIYKKSGGSFRDSESLLTKLMSVGKDGLISVHEVYTALGILNDDDLSNLANLLKSRDVEGSIKSFDQFIEKGYSANNILDNLIEYLHDLMISDIKSANQYLPIVNFAITSKSLLKDFVDKNLILKLEIIKFCSDGKGIIGNSNQSIISINPTEPKLSNALSVDKTKEIKSDNPGIILSEKSGNNDFKNLIADLSKEEYPRLRQIILNSTIEIINNSMRISTPYKMNALFLKKPEIKNFIISLFAKSGISLSNVNVEESAEKEIDMVIKTQEITVEKVEESISEKILDDQAESLESSEEITEEALQSMDIIETTIVTENKNADNSDLVESLL